MWYELESGRKSPRSRVCSLGFPSPWTPWAITWHQTSLQISIFKKIYYLRVMEFFFSTSVHFSCSVVSDSLRPLNCSTPGLLVNHQLLEFTKTHIHWVGDAIQPSHPLSSLLLLPPIPPSIRVFSNESTLRMRWPKFQLQHHSFQRTLSTDLL